jgi:phosphoribosyl-ATP pyrophosphohydrolase
MNLAETKEKVVRFISEHGPSLPVHITKVTGMNLTFSSALLSELLADRKLKLSNLRIGSSPLYFIPGQEEKLEGFIANLKEPEKEAFKKLKQNKILADEKQDSVTRVALRSIRDFAIPLKNKEKLYWKYYLFPDEKATVAISETDEPVQAIGQERVLGQQIWEDIQKQQISKDKIEELVKKQVEEIARKIKEESRQLIPNRTGQDIEKIAPEQKEMLNRGMEDISPPSGENKKELAKEQENLPEEAVQDAKQNLHFGSPKTSTRQQKKKDSSKEILVREIKNYAESKKITLLEILKAGNGKAIARAKREQAFLLVLFYKKKLDEKEILKELKKWDHEGLEVEIHLEGELPKKIGEKINLFKKIKSIEQIG